jgi:hypothetical protein
MGSNMAPPPDNKTAATVVMAVGVSPGFAAGNDQARAGRCDRAVLGIWRYGAPQQTAACNRSNLSRQGAWSLFGHEFAHHSSMDKHWDLGVREHLNRLASKDDRGDAAPAVRGHHDEVAAIRLRGIDDCPVGILVLDTDQLARDA